MAQIIQFPGLEEREWHGIEEDLRRDFADLPDGPGTIEECLPVLREHWKAVYPAFSVPVSYEIPEPVSEAQREAIASAVSAGVNAVAAQLRKERARSFAAIIGSEYKAAYFRRNGPHV